MELTGARGHLAPGGRRAGGRGRTSWRRFALASTGSLALAVGTIATTTATAVPVSFALADSPFSVTAHRLQAVGAVQFASFRQDASGRQRPVAAVGLREATLYGLCLSAVSHTPLGTATLLIRADEQKPVRASSMALDLALLQGDMAFGQVELGRDAATLQGGGIPGPSGTYGQQAGTLTIKHMRLEAWSVTAGMFSLNSATLQVRAGEQSCR